MTITKTFTDINLYMVDFKLLIRGGLNNTLILKQICTKVFVIESDMLDFVEKIKNDKIHYEDIKVTQAPIQIDVTQVREYKLEGMSNE